MDSERTPLEDFWWNLGYEAGRLAQREKDARIAEAPETWKKLIPTDRGMSNITVAGRYIARAIREARGAKESDHA